MSDLVRCIAGTFAIFIIPLGVTYSIFTNRIAIALRWWIGILLIGLVVLICHGFYTLQFVPLTVIGMLSIYGTFRALRTKSFPLQLGFNDSLPYIAILLMLMACYIFVLANPLNPFYSDAVSIWFRKAKFIFYWNPLSADSAALKTYPHLGPSLQAYVMKFTGTETYEAYGRWIYPTFYFMWSLALFDLIKKDRSPVVLYWTVPFVSLALFHQPHMTNGYQDGFVASLVGTTAICAIHFMKSRKDGQPWFLLIFMFLAGCLGLVKIEGTVWAIILVFACLVVALFARRTQPTEWRVERKVAALSFVVFVLLLIIWPTILWVNHINLQKIQADAYNPSTMFKWYLNLDRWSVIEPYFFAYLKQYGLIIGSAFFLSLTAFITCPGSRTSIGFMWTCLMLHLMFTPIPFFATQLPLEWHIRSALSRLMFQEICLYGNLIIVGVSEIVTLLTHKSTIPHASS